ncbi:hypothetical protein L838_1132 [Mycobacterium avium MAV_120709_2344]|nr:hypothetical protein L838_1132 [Mycobacterium avium MAV_120709_2344]
MSLLAALAEDPAVSTVVMQCIVDAAQDGLKYMHQHAGYTRSATRSIRRRRICSDCRRYRSSPTSITQRGRSGRHV